MPTSKEIREKIRQVLCKFQFSTCIGKLFNSFFNRSYFIYKSKVFYTFFSKSTILFTTFLGEHRKKLERFYINFVFYDFFFQEQNNPIQRILYFHWCQFRFSDCMCYFLSCMDKLFEIGNSKSYHIFFVFKFFRLFWDDVQSYPHLLTSQFIYNLFIFTLKCLNNLSTLLIISFYLLFKF